MIYICFQNETDDYSTLPADEPRKFLFSHIKGPPNVEHIQHKLREVLDGCDPDNDSIIFNGPAYLCAMAGYIWFTHPNRARTNYYSYNTKDKCYVKHTELLEE
jgi:hypothetical protein